MFGGPGRDRTDDLPRQAGTRLARKQLYGFIKDLVDLVGIEPTTSSMPWKRAPNCATGPLGGVTLLSPTWIKSSNESGCRPSKKRTPWGMHLRARALGQNDFGKMELFTFIFVFFKES